MNNTHMKFEPGLDGHTNQQQQYMLSGPVKMDHSLQEHNGLNQHYMAPAGDNSNESMQPDAAAWPTNSNTSGALPGYPVGSPGTGFDAAGTSGFNSVGQLPANSAASHGSTDLDRMTPGLPQYSEQQAPGLPQFAEQQVPGLPQFQEQHIPGLPQFAEQQSFGSNSAAGAAPGQLQDMHPGALPAVGAGSPVRDGPTPATQGFGLASSSSLGAADRAMNGHTTAKAGSSAAAQQHNRASSSHHYASGRSSAAVAAAAAAGEGQQVFRSQYRGVSYDKKKRKWRVQIKVAALGKSGLLV